MILDVVILGQKVGPAPAITLGSASAPGPAMAVAVAQFLTKSGIIPLLHSSGLLL